MKSLILEDDFISSSLLKAILTPFGQVDVVDNGMDGIKMFKQSLEVGAKYQLVCLDIMVPKMDGQEVLIEIRQLEKQWGIVGNDSTKIIMITALRDFENVKQAFREQCEAYLVKPIDRDQLLLKLQEFDLI